LAGDWTPPVSTGWIDSGFTSLVVTIARFHHTSGVAGLLRRVGQSPNARILGIGRPPENVGKRLLSAPMHYRGQLAINIAMISRLTNWRKAETYTFSRRITCPARRFTACAF